MEVAMKHRFGGRWTEEKLEILEDYLKAYRRIFDTNVRARALTTWYVDAFAGTGTRTDPETRSEESSLFSELSDPEMTSVYRGSAEIANHLLKRI